MNEITLIIIKNLVLDFIYISVLYLQVLDVNKLSLVFTAGLTPGRRAKIAWQARQKY